MDESGSVPAASGVDDATDAAATEERPASLTAALASANQQLRTIDEFAAQMTGTLDLERVLAITLEHIAAIVQCERCAVLRHDAAGTFSSVALWQRRPDLGHVEGRVVSSQTSVSGIVARTAAPYVEDDISRSTATDLGGKNKLLAMGINSRAGVPVSVGKLQWGTLIVEFTQIAGATPERVAFLSGLATHVAVAIQHAELYSSLHKAHEALQVAQEEAVHQERLLVSRQMAGGVARELQDSLALVVGYGQLAREVLHRPVLDRRLLDEILAAIVEAGHIRGQRVDRLLAFASNQPAEAAEPAEPIELGALLQEVARSTASRWLDTALAEGRVIHVTVEAEAGLWVGGWPPGLRSAFTNLVLNAVDALPRGGTIRLIARRRGDHVVAEVADDGTGIPPEVLPRVFEPFFTTKGDRGMGIGLAEVKRITERHQGVMEVDSVPNRGTTFRIVLPLAAAPAPAAGAAQPGVSSLPGGALRILVVDDEEGIRLLMAAILEPLGYAVVSVGSGEAALDHMAAERFDLVISDIGMGDGMNGWELAEQVRARSPGTRFLLATGWGAAVDAAELDAKGVHGILTKPYNVREFQRQVALVTASP